MDRSIVIFCVFVLLMVLGCGSDTERDFALPERVDFNFHIKPILSDRCFACHGPDAKARKADLRLDEEAFAFSLVDSTKGTFVIKPGDLKNSALIQRITTDDPEQIMPPPESNLILTPYEVALLQRWVQQGAEWKQHWSFIIPEKAPVPAVSDPEWPNNAIDYYVLEKLDVLKKSPAPSASKEKLLRRLSFDLTGLPPSPERIDSFLSDDSENSYEELVDKLFASKAFGERLATEWIDLARYAETNGYHHDFERNMWPWRDWVIEAINANMPYDQFVTWQLAGDLLPDATYEQRLATAFNRNNRTTQECGSIDEEFRVSYVIDRTNTLGKAFLGLTVECSQCHDHKYDPISQKEYYQLSAFFNQVPEQGVTESFKGQPAPFLPLPEDEIKRIRNYIDDQLTTEYRTGSEQDAEEEYKSNWKEELEAMLEPVMVMKDLDTIRPTYILDRGLYDAPGEIVSHGTPASVFPFPSEFEPNRLGLSQWLFSPNNPLTARVAVNRYWQMIFGNGLVDTPDDFGNQGSLPTHPQLLDWLAVEFVESDWDVKALLKTIVMSATYQQASRTDSSDLVFDPTNKWLSRGGQLRLSAEMVRDQALMVSGLLNPQSGGPSVKPYQPEGLWTQVSSGGRYQRKYMKSHGTDLYRRSLYTYWKRIQPPPAMIIFDAADRSLCSVKRQSTNTPLQALVLLNDRQFVEASRALAERMIIEGGSKPEERIVYGFKWATSRKPDLEEQDVLVALLEGEMDEFKTYPERAKAFLQVGDFENTDKIDAETLASYAVVANTILNLSESLQKN